ncbi:aromatic-ring hydroxylase C-terminal domain-containing protein [Streptomyces sp. NBC_00704]|uniref:aromatic-ring hydroxylase C-terminal domain-containing protein n=1 Tax=Streptomyces sp. NBC_00704 TaxID=2975809 RepID=UPI002E333118|nr:hypothetical protein [Streptomyces sp. NBC_00704]
MLPGARRASVRPPSRGPRPRGRVGAGRRGAGRRGAGGPRRRRTGATRPGPVPCRIGRRQDAGQGAGQVDVRTRTARERSGLTALLVRPDGCVAWAADPGHVPQDTLEAALERWFGPPAA